VARSSLRGAPYWRGARYEVNRVGGQAEEVAACEVLVEEDDGGEVPWPDFTSRCCGQALGAGGAQG
jgi:hypothetical protein